ncbi:MAG: GH3 auxin-responsive promoter family protein [Candidatus Melainabacteria bacterium]|nr:GH3 auxin-responsive promoter family protein [Candidatus Melainabacteria bacterium]
MQNKFMVGILIKLLRAACFPTNFRFHKSLADPQIAQQDTYWKIMADFAQTDYAKSFGITGDENYKEFAAKVPIQTYEELEPWIDRQLKFPTAKVLTPHKIVHAEPTSGSTSNTKYIPYTGKLVNSFSNLFGIWAYDLLQSGLKLETGRIFISVSPKPGNPKQKGFQSDKEYLQEPLKTLASQFLLTPPATTDSAQFQHALAMTLLADKRLEIISVWSPTYMLSLLDYIEQNKVTLQKSVILRTLPFPENGPIDWQKVWPKLKLISCWDDASAELAANQLKKCFPGVRIQGKGLLATEAPFTVPLSDAEGCLPLLNDVFLEFEDSQGVIKRLHELVDHEQYQVIVTQNSGLTRYRMNDIVEVRGFYSKTPMLEFIGRANAVCDLAGEKLHEEFVRNALTPLLSDTFLVVPNCEKDLGYMMLVDSRTITNQDELAEKAEEALCSAHHYKLARTQNQIAALELQLVENLSMRLQDFHQSEGMKLGNIKDTAFINDPEKAARLLAFISEKKQNNQPLRVSLLEESSVPHPAFLQPDRLEVGS